MKYQAYLDATRRAAELVERGDHEEAIAVLKKLVASDISDIDKAMMCLNLAIVHDKLGRVDEALAWYDRGANYEGLHDRYYVAERKAVYLEEKGRHRESLDVYRRLLTRRELTEGEKARLEQNVQILQGRGIKSL